MGKKFRKPITYNACRWLSVYDVSVEFDRRFEVYRVFFCAFEKADIQLKIKTCNNELKKSGSKNNQLNKEVNSSKTKEELEKEIFKLEKIEERRRKRRKKILEENKISDSSRVTLEDVENRLMEKFKSGTEQGKERKRRIVSSFKFPKFMYCIPPFISQCCLHSSPMSCCFKVTSHSFTKYTTNK